MIIKGKSVAHARDHARHLMRIDQNDRIEILELDVTAAAPTIEAALVEYQTLAEHLTHASKGLYIATINPRVSEHLDRDQWTRAVNILEKEMGLIGHPRVVILHEKDGREHVHIVWQRAMTHERKVWDDGQNYAKHERAARKIEQVFNLEPTPGKHSREPGEHIPDPANRQKEEQQASRAGYALKDLQAEVKEYFNDAETGRGFVTRLEEKGFYLARGDKGNHFMIVTPQGDTKRLQSVLKGIPGKAVKEKLFPLVPDKLQTASEIQAAMKMPEQAAEEAQAIHDLFDRQAFELRETQELARSRQEAHHRLDNEQVKRERAHQKPGGVYKLFQNVYGLSWFRNRLHDRADRERLSEQRQALAYLKREQSNARQVLSQERVRVIAELDQKTRGDPGANSRFEVNKAKTLLHHVQGQARAVARHTEKNTRLQDINQYLDWFREWDKKYQARQGRYEAIEADAKGSFAKLYQDGQVACDAYRELARKETLPKAVSVLKNKSERFGEIKKATTAELREEQAAAIKAVRQFHYMETKLGNEHKRLIEERQNVRKMQEEKLRILTAFSDERLALMRGLQQAAIGLSKEDLQALDISTRHEIRQARAAFKDRDQGETAGRGFENRERGLTRKTQLQNDGQSSTLYGIISTSHFARKKSVYPAPLHIFIVACDAGDFQSLVPMPITADITGESLGHTKNTEYGASPVYPPKLFFELTFPQYVNVFPFSATG